jgi:hypothetical protein
MIELLSCNKAACLQTIRECVSRPPLHGVALFVRKQWAEAAPRHHGELGLQVLELRRRESGHSKPEHAGRYLKRAIWVMACEQEQKQKIAYSQILFDSFRWSCFEDWR